MRGAPRCLPVRPSIPPTAPPGEVGQTSHSRRGPISPKSGDTADHRQTALPRSPCLASVEPKGTGLPVRRVTLFEEAQQAAGALPPSVTSFPAWKPPLLGVGSSQVDHVGRLLRDLGWSPQKPQRRAVKRDEAEIQRWVKEEWPRVKKSHPPEGLPRLPGQIRPPDGSLYPTKLGSPRPYSVPVSAHAHSAEAVHHRRPMRVPAPRSGRPLLPPPSPNQYRHTSGPRLLASAAPATPFPSGLGLRSAQGSSEQVRLGVRRADPKPAHRLASTLRSGAEPGGDGLGLPADQPPGQLRLLRSTHVDGNHSLSWPSVTQAPVAAPFLHPPRPASCAPTVGR